MEGHERIGICPRLNVIVVIGLANILKIVRKEECSKVKVQKQLWLQHNKFNNRRRRDDQRGGGDRRIRYAIDDREEDHHPQQRSRD